MFTTNVCIVVIGVAFVVTSCATPGQGAPSVASASASASEQSLSSRAPQGIYRYESYDTLPLLFQFIRRKDTPSDNLEPPPPLAAPSTSLGEPFEQETLPAVPSLNLEPPPPPPPPTPSAPPPEQNQPDLDQGTVDKTADYDYDITEESTDQVTDQATELSIDQVTELSTELSTEQVPDLSTKEDTPIMICNVVCYRFTKEGKLIRIIVDEVPDDVFYDTTDDLSYDVIDDEGEEVPEQATNQITGQVTDQDTDKDTDKGTDPITNQIIDEVQDRIPEQDGNEGHTPLLYKIVDPRTAYDEKSQSEKQRLFQKWNKYPKKFYGERYRSYEKDLSGISAKDSLHWRLRRSAVSSDEDTFNGDYGSHSRASAVAGYVEPNSQDIYRSEPYDAQSQFPLNFIPEVPFSFPVPDMVQAPLGGYDISASIQGPAQGSFSRSQDSVDENGNRHSEVQVGVL